MRALPKEHEATVISALVFYAFHCYTGDHCVDALRALGWDASADGLADFLRERDEARKVSA